MNIVANTHKNSPVKFVTSSSVSSSTGHGRWSWGCCKLGNSMGSVVSAPPTNNNNNYGQYSASQLQNQIEMLKRELQRQKEEGVIYKKKVERTQEYLRYCLQIAEDHGFLNFIINHQLSPLPQPPSSLSPEHPHPHLASIIHQAKAQGWYIHPQEIELDVKLIGEGSTAEIYKGIWRGSEVAVKCIRPDLFHRNHSTYSFFAQEIETLSRQRHRFVIQMMGACIDPPYHGWVVTELLGETLKDWIYGRDSKRSETRSDELRLKAPLKDRVEKALEIAQAMQYLHEQTPKVIHRDLKPSNIFLDDAGHVRLADFGHARFLSHHQMALTGETGTYVYMAPEVIRCEPYNEKCDVYSFGIILNELITGEYPYIETHYSPAQIAMEVGEGRVRPAVAGEDDEDDEVMREVIKLIRVSWDGDASLRPSFATITCTLKHLLQNYH